MADPSDWTNLSNDDDLADQWEFAKPILDEVKALLNLKEIRTGSSAPDDIVKGLILGDETNDKVVRIRAHDSNGSFLVEKNTGIDDSPTWVAVATFDTSGNLTLTGGLTATGITAAHASSHDPSGSDPLSETGTVTEVTQAASVAGTAEGWARKDHAHRGARSVKKTGEAAIYGDVEFDEGSNVTIVQAGQKLTISSAATATAAALHQADGGTDQDITSGAGLTDVTDLTGLSFPGSVGSGEEYMVHVALALMASATSMDVQARLYKGSNGASASDTLHARVDRAFLANDPGFISFSYHFTPSSGDLVTVAVETDSGTITVRMAQTAGLKSWVAIWRVM